MIKIFLSSIAKNDIRLLIRVFNAEETGKGKRFLEDLKLTMDDITTHPDVADSKYSDVMVHKMTNFPAHIHYTVENNDEICLFVTAVFKEN